MKPYYQDGRAGIVLYNADCRDILPSLTNVGSVLTDPPYGLGKAWTGGTWFTRGVYAEESMSWDSSAPHDVIETLLALKVPTILWGGNHFVVPPSRCWLVWEKTNSVETMSDCELAWTNIDAPSRLFSHACNGWPRTHPTEKPLDLIKWSLNLISEPGVVLDPFVGSGTTLRAAKDAGYKAIGIEKEERYCESAVKRLAQEVFRFQGETS